MRVPLLVALLLFSRGVFADDLVCGTSAENDRALQRLDAITRSRVESHAATPAVLRDGVVYLQADEGISPDHHALDLAVTSLVFEPASATAMRPHKEPLRYVAPAAPAVRDFALDASTVTHDLPFTAQLFGRAVTRIYVTAFNSIRLDPPLRDEEAEQVDAADAAAHRQAVISPLLLTKHRPPALAYPEVFIEDADGSVIVTWRKSSGDFLHYDVQAEIHQDGTLVFSYKELSAHSWGTPVITAGLPDDAARESLGSGDDPAGDNPDGLAMLDIRRIEVLRVYGSNLFSIRITAGARILPSLLNGDLLWYDVSFGNNHASIYVHPDGSVTTIPFGGSREVSAGASVQFHGNVIEIFGVQAHSTDAVQMSGSVLSGLGSQLDPTEWAETPELTVLPAPRAIDTDLSAADGSRDVPLPIVEPFTLPSFNPYVVEQRLRAQFPLNDGQIDAIAIYQTFLTDIVFFAGAYATQGNSRAAGTNMGYSALQRWPTLLHMSDLSYGYNATEQAASRVLLHELGHRWLYNIAIREDGRYSRVLAPRTFHPAAYVHTPAAFPVYGSDESSVMGGGFFSEQGDGSYRAHAANNGYSWTDLYLMGIAAPGEVPPWFYLAGTDLPLDYWPAEGAVVNGIRHDVTIEQVVAANGERLPASATSSKRFRVLFVLVTEPGQEPTDAEVARMNALRALMERNFSIATGGRASVSTTFTIPSKVRAVR